MTASASAREFSRYLDAIVELTRQQDSQELMGALLEGLRKSVQVRRVQMFALSNPDRDTDFSENNIQHAVFNDQFDSEFGEPRRLRDDPDLVASIVKIARALDIGIFAQAVEDESLVPLLLELGFSGYQGYATELPVRIT